jgi:hypothetical protein
VKLDADLLPTPGVSVRCAPFAEALGVDPGGTAFHTDEIIVVEMPLPWPKPVWAKGGFTAVPEWVQSAGSAGRAVRVLAAVPEPDRGGPALVVHRRGNGGGFERQEFRVDRREVIDALESLLAGSPANRPTAIDGAAPSCELLVCAQGSHDVCCGSRGPALANEIAAARPDVRVTRVSHTGGHRFAPTAVSLPDGRMWGRLDLDAALAVIDRTGSPADVAARCRGWTGAAEGPAQVAERAVFAALGDWAFDDRPRVVEVIADTAGVAVCRVTSGDRRWIVEVAEGRAVPTIACGEPGGLPAKPGREWRVRALRGE